jgi:hypothetical protein
MVALIPKNISELISKNLTFIRQHSMLFVYGMPLLVLAIAVVFRKKGEGNNV